MDDDHQQGRRVDADRVSSDEQVIEVMDAEKVDMMDDNDQATHEQTNCVRRTRRTLLKSDGSNDDEQDPATMLPRDQLPAVEALQSLVKSEVGGFAEKVDMMDNDDQATHEQPIVFYEKQENLTKTDESNDDDEHDLATMLPHDQQRAVEECQPHVKSEVGSGAGSTPVLKGTLGRRSPLILHYQDHRHSFPQLCIILVSLEYYFIIFMLSTTNIQQATKVFTNICINLKRNARRSLKVDYAPQENDFIQYLLNSEPIPMSLPMNLILGNNQHSNVSRPKGIQQANRQHFQQMPIQNMASSEDNNSNRAYGNLPQDLRLDSSMLPVLSSDIYTLNNTWILIYLRAQEIQSQGLTPSQAAPAVNGSFYSPGTNFSQMNPFDNIPVVPQGMPANFLNRNNAYQPVAGELPRATPRPRISMSNWQENVNIPAQNLLANNNWLPQGQSSQGLQNYSNNASASSSR
ncbi:hypothetical protein DVH24_022255 [Malus domestica]|uniref:Uncharacterized protein n=1 Tax=Malus domestica TaxID=3750 RepID=A0A498IDW7_MALDO|nr:hypothetical protein DVH24_022255 [Malus domestica]